MSDLSQLLSTEKRDPVISELASYAEQVISEQRGVTGFAIKGAVGTAKAVDSDVVAKAVTRVLPGILGDLDRHWQDFQASEEEDFGAFISPRSEDVVDSVMTVADDQATKLNVTALRKAYEALRGRAGGVIKPAVPDLARILQRHMG